MGPRRQRPLRDAHRRDPWLCLIKRSAQLVPSPVARRPRALLPLALLHLPAGWAPLRRRQILQGVKCLLAGREDKRQGAVDTRFAQIVVHRAPPLITRRAESAAATAASARSLSRGGRRPRLAQVGFEPLNVSLQPVESRDRFRDGHRLPPAARSPCTSGRRPAIQASTARPSQRSRDTSGPFAPNHLALCDHSHRGKP